MNPVTVEIPEIKQFCFSYGPETTPVWEIYFDNDACVMYAFIGKYYYDGETHFNTSEVHLIDFDGYAFSRKVDDEEIIELTSKRFLEIHRSRANAFNSLEHTRIQLELDRMENEPYDDCPNVPYLQEDDWEDDVYG